MSEEKVIVEEPKPKRHRRTRAEIAAAREAIPSPKPLDTPGKPKKAKGDGADPIFACDKFPWLHIFIPAWAEDPALKELPYVSFMGGRLNMKRFREVRKLTPGQVEQAIDILKRTKYVYIINTRGPVRCDICGKECSSMHNLQEHNTWIHAEELGLTAGVRNPK